MRKRDLLRERKRGKEREKARENIPQRFFRRVICWPTFGLSLFRHRNFSFRFGNGSQCVIEVSLGSSLPSCLGQEIRLRGPASLEWYKVAGGGDFKIVPLRLQLVHRL